MTLFEKENTNACSAYKVTRNGKRRIEVMGRELCNKLWSKYKPYADKHFENEFPRSFYARFWEMDLACALLDHKFEISSSNKGPDICIHDGDEHIWIEAIAPSSGSGPDKVPEVKAGSNVAQRLPDEQIMLRLTAAIAEKHNKYKKYVAEGVIPDNEPYVIAINGRQIYPTSAEGTVPKIIRAVLPIGLEYVEFGDNDSTALSGGFKFKDKIRKSNGVDISTDSFLSPYFEGVSAVLYSHSDCFNRPEADGADYVLVHNPFAKNPLSEGTIQYGRECIPELLSDTTYTYRWNNYVVKAD